MHCAFIAACLNFDFAFIKFALNLKIYPKEGSTATLRHGLCSHRYLLALFLAQLSFPCSNLPSRIFSAQIIAQDLLPATQSIVCPGVCSVCQLPLTSSFIPSVFYNKPNLPFHFLSLDWIFEKWRPFLVCPLNRHTSSFSLTRSRTILQHTENEFKIINSNNLF